MKTILLVEDNPDDAFFTKAACLRSGFPHNFNFVSDGDAALDYLAGKNAYADRLIYPFPDLVLLDLNLPKRDGYEVLKWIRSHPATYLLPVIMLTTSQQSSDVDRAYKLGVTSYLRKVADAAEFGQGIRIILKYWFELNVSPTLQARAHDAASE